MTIQSMLRFPLQWVLDRRRAATTCRLTADDLASSAQATGHDTRRLLRTEARMPEADWRICGQRRAPRR